MSWTANHDRDNELLTYRVIRDGVPSNAVGLTIRNMDGPQISAVTPGSALVYSEVTVAGRNFASLDSGGAPARIFAVLEKSSLAKVFVRPTAASPTERRIFVRCSCEWA